MTTSREQLEAAYDHTQLAADHRRSALDAASHENVAVVHALLSIGDRLAAIGVLLVHEAGDTGPREGEQDAQE